MKTLLNPTEQRIVEFIKEGTPNKLIAKKINMSLSGVDMSIKRLRDKHQASDKTTLILTLIKKQIIDL